MLYEVITHEVHVAEIDRGPLRTEDRQRHGIVRITSYNVCYTKLLRHRDLRPFANLVLNRYLQRRDDLAGLAALPLFLATRAAVRAKVSVSMAGSQNVV